MLARLQTLTVNLYEFLLDGQLHSSQVLLTYKTRWKTEVMKPIYLHTGHDFVNLHALLDYK